MFVGFSPSEQDMKDWQHTMKENLLEDASRPLRRSVWNHPDSSDRRALIDVAECSSAEEAMKSLVTRLEGNELARLNKGPDDLGTISFMHPEGSPPAVFYTRGNLCISVISIAPQPVEVLKLAQTLNLRLQSQSKIASDIIQFKPGQDHAKVGEDVSVSYQLLWKLAEQGYLKFTVHGGSIARKKDSLIITGSKPGVLQLEAIAIEPGREPDGGKLSLRIELVDNVGVQVTTWVFWHNAQKGIFWRLSATFSFGILSPEIALDGVRLQYVFVGGSFFFPAGGFDRKSTVLKFNSRR
ncbi:MAG: hypothetical protein GY799_12565 [Desulfobulbaceae bacterium]|nr:hypothetical protein [Desulfobulbaceae bacterium]